MTGIIKEVFFTEGRDVKEGDRLYLIDPLPFEAAVLSAKAQVSQAEVRLIQTRQDYERVKPLLEEQAVSQKDVDDTVTEGLAANASLDAANADLVKAQFKLNNTLIVAPISGVTERSRLYEGHLVSANTDLLTKIRQLDPIYVNVSVPETYILRRRKELAEKRVQRGDLFQLRGTLTFTDGSTYPHQGVLDFADVAFRPETGMLQGRFVFPNPRELFGPEDEETSPRLLPGQFVKLRLLGYTRHDALLVPQRAVQQGPTGSVLFMVGEGDIVEMRDVSATMWYGNQWLIEEGIYPGERVVTDGLHMIRPGIQVKPIMQTDDVPATAPEPVVNE